MTSPSKRLATLQCLLGMAVLAAATQVGAQTMFRCGNVYQDRACESGQASKVLGAPSAGKPVIAPSAPASTPAPRTVAEAPAEPPKRLTTEPTEAASPAEAASTAAQQNAEAERIAARRARDKQERCNNLAAERLRIQTLQRAGVDAVTMERLKQQFLNTEQARQEAACPG